MTSKSGLIDFSTWYATAFGRHSPWGDADSEALTTIVESALERRLSALIMQGDTARHIRIMRPDQLITQQGAEEDDLILVLDGVVRVELNGERLAELGPGVILGERAIIEGGRRTSTLRAVTACKLVVVPSDRIDREVLAEVSKSHRRESQSG